MHSGDWGKDMGAIRFFAHGLVSRVLSGLVGAVFLLAAILSNVAPSFAMGATMTVLPALTGAPTASQPTSPTVVRELVASRTADSSTFLMSDGSYRADIAAGPIHYRDARGVWQDIDPTLVPSQTVGAVHTKASEYDIAFASTSDATSPVQVDHGDWSMGMRLIGAQQSDLFSLGKTAEFPLAMTDTTLSYQTLPNGMKDTLTLASKDAPDTFTFFVNLDNLSILSNPLGGYVLCNRAGKQVGRITPLSVFDSSAGSVAPGSLCTSATMSVTSAAGGAYVTYRVPRSWMDDPARVYPVQVDPQIIYGGDNVACDTFVAQGDPNGAHYSDTKLDVGYVGTYKTCRTLVKFNLGTILPGATITSAKFQLYCYTNTSAGSPTVIVDPITSSWPYNVTWNNQPTYSPTGDYIGVSGTGYKIWTGMGPTVQKWYDGTLSNNGLIVLDKTEGSTDSYRQYRQSEYGTSSETPHLTVDYTNPTCSASGVAASYHTGDTVNITVQSNSTKITNLQAQVMGSSGSGPQRGEFAFTSFLPGSPWVSQAVSGGYISYYPPSFPAGAIIPNLAASTTSAGSGYRTVTFVFQIGSAYGDVGTNDVQVADFDWMGSWADTGMRYTIVPDPVSSLSTSASTVPTWFAEADTNGDGVNDLKNDTNAAGGRGSVGLSWPAAANASSYNIYAFDGVKYDKVDSTTSTSWASSGRGIYPSDTGISALTTGTAADPLPTNNSGLDLRDDPRPLYQKMTGLVTSLDPHYYFKVTAVNAGNETLVSSATTAQATLQDCTMRVADDPQHASYDLGDLFRHTGSADLERGSLELDVTDLKIASWGPVAELSRHYSSTLATATTYAPGWRFSFEQSLMPAGATMLYTDASGDIHRFTNAGGTWVAPNGMVATLAQAGSNWTITLKDRSVLTFNSTGQLVSEADADGNSVNYVRSPGLLVITAANGQSISVSLTGLGVVTQATYATDAGSRTVLYDGGAGYSGTSPTTVTYYPGDADMYQSVYGYGENGAPATALTSIACPQYVWSDRIGGPEWVFGYDGTSRLTSWQLIHTTYPYGSNTITYGSATATVTKATGNRNAGYGQTNQSLSWNPNGTLAAETAILDPSKSWTWLYGPTNAEIYSTTPLAHTVTSVLDAHDNVLSSTDELGHTTSHTYDAVDRELSQTDPRGAVDSKAYTGPDLSSETKSLTSTQSVTTQWDRNSNGLVTEERKGVAVNTTATTDYSNFAANGEPQTTVNRGVVLSPNTSGVDITSSKHFDNFGNLVWQQTPVGLVTTDTYTTSGHLATSEVPTGTVTSYTYDALGGIRQTFTQAGTQSANCSLDLHNPAGALELHVELTDANTNDWGGQLQNLPDLAGQPYETYHYDQYFNMTGYSYYAYDGEEHQVRAWPSGGGIWQPADDLATRTTYDTEGHVVSSTEPGANANPTITTYSPGGLVTRVDNADGSWETKVYDPSGNQTTDTKSRASGQATTTASYDLGDRETSSTDANGAETDYTYDLAGNQLSAGIQGHPSSTSTYNTLGWVLTTTDPDGVVTKNSYDPGGRVTLTDVGGKQTSSVLDPSGNVLSQTDPTGATTTNTYDAFLRKTEEKHTLSGVTLRDIRTVYDSQSRVLETSQTVGGAVTRDEVFNAGMLSSSVLGYGNTTSTVTYSIAASTEQNRVVSAADISSFTRTVSTYDAAQHATAWNVTGGLLMSGQRTFDGAERESGRSGTGFSGATTISYGQDGRKSSELLPFALGSSVNSTFTYTPDGRLNGIGGSGAGTFGYDSAGDLATFTATVDGSGTTTSGVLGYDGAGRLSVRYAADGVTPLEYIGFDSANGWRTSSKRGVEASVTYGYDPGGHLTSYAKPAGSLGTTWAIGASYTYDALGQRSTSVVTSGSLTTTTTWTYDGLQLDALSASRSDGANWSVTYLYDEEGHPFAGVYRSNSSAPVTFGIVTTDRGDVAELADASGAIFASYRYDAWGRPLSAITATDGAIPVAEIAARQVIRYAGYVYDAESGTYYCSSRTYDPATMQFLEKDPAKADGEQSAYQYCGGDPANRVDPRGLGYWKLWSDTKWILDYTHHFLVWRTRYYVKYQIWVYRSGRPLSAPPRTRLWVSYEYYPDEEYAKKLELTYSESQMWLGSWTTVNRSDTSSRQVWYRSLHPRLVA